MKAKFTLLFIFLLTNKTAISQTNKISVDSSNKNTFFNEYWSKSTGNLGSVFFDNYYFDENGTFIHTYGYSGGMYYVTNCKGIYKYNPAKNEIKLFRIKCDKEKLSKARQTPSKIVIKELADTAVTLVDPKNGSDFIMHRSYAMTTDQYWYKGSNSSHNSIHFTRFGQAIIVQETDIRREYVCNYHILNNYLFLEMKSMTTGEHYSEKQTTPFTPEIKTYIKINIEKDSVYLENIDLNETINGNRNWIFQNMEYLIEATNNSKSNTEYDVYTRVIENE